MKIIKEEQGIFTVQGERGTYEVIVNPFNCTCQDYKFRKEKLGQICKHINFVLDEKNKECMEFINSEEI